MHTPQRFSLFLTPCDRDFAYLDQIIRRLADSHNALSFEPHLTLYSGSCATWDPVGNAAMEAVQGVTPFSLNITGVDFSPDYFKTLFIQFNDNAVIRGVHDRFRQVMADSGYRLNPHLSLLYHDMAMAEKESLARSIILDRAEIGFGSVKVVAPPEGGWGDTAGWRTMFSFRLGSCGC